MKTKKQHYKPKNSLKKNVINDDLQAAKEAFKQDYSDLDLALNATTDEELLLTNLFDDDFIIQ